MRTNIYVYYVRSYTSATVLVCAAIRWTDNESLNPAKHSYALNVVVCVWTASYARWTAHVRVYSCVYTTTVWVYYVVCVYNVMLLCVRCKCEVAFVIISNTASHFSFVQSETQYSYDSHSKQTRQASYCATPTYPASGLRSISFKTNVKVDTIK